MLRLGNSSDGSAEVSGTTQAAEHIEKHFSRASMAGAPDTSSVNLFRLVCVLSFCIVGCPVGADFVGPVRHVCLGNSTGAVGVEIAATPATRQKGLMLRESLDKNSGMLFLYQSAQPPSQGFWMYQVQFPLDIAFISEDGSIVSISRMEPCLSSDPKSCPAYYSQKPFQSALEVNAGFFAAAGIEVGDKVRYAVDGKCEHQ